MLSHSPRSYVVLITITLVIASFLGVIARSVPYYCMVKDDVVTRSDLSTFVDRYTQCAQFGQCFFCTSRTSRATKVRSDTNVQTRPSIHVIRHSGLFQLSEFLHKKQVEVCEVHSKTSRGMEQQSRYTLILKYAQRCNTHDEERFRSTLMYHLRRHVSR